MVMTILLLIPFVWLTAFNSLSEARTLPTSVKLHRRFTFVAHAPPQDWSTDSLEDYDQYHFRFLSIGCHQKKTTDDKFFEACCHPRMKSDDLSKIPVECHLSPKSMLAAHDYILKSTNYRGEITSGVGTPVYVKNGTVEPMKPVEDRSASEPPTPAQLADLLQAQKKVQVLNDQYKSQGNNTSAPEALITTDQSTQDMPASNNSPSRMATPPKVSKALLKDVDVDDASVANLTSKTDEATDAVVKQVSDSAASQKAATEAAAKKAADDAAAQKAATEAAAKKAVDDAAAQKAADAAAAQKAASDAAAKKSTDDAASASKQKSDDASSSKSSDDSASTQHDASSAGALSGVSQVFGSDGDAKGTYFYQEGAAGACGNVNSDNTPLVALPTDMYEGGKHCGKQVMIKNTANGKTVVAKVQDMCPGCPSSTSLDLSTGAYDALGSQATGVLPIQWGFVQ